MNCPLCKKELVKVNYGNQFQWECPTQVNFHLATAPTLEASSCHFTHENNRGLWVQEWIVVPPYRIQINYSANVSVIDKLYSVTYSEMHVDRKPILNFKEIMTCPRITFTSETDLLSKIKTLIMFS